MPSLLAASCSPFIVIFCSAVMCISPFLISSYFSLVSSVSLVPLGVLAVLSAVVALVFLLVLVVTMFFSKLLFSYKLLPKVFHLF